ncbi:DUF3558 domain-containing protein [Kutzneria sp. NPDC052558]|uniref:DUF3558 domain-containing protein n=1 Tax=Kutzneria sp. NPDC052558 TaxID=3364121 RepID=UPI0037C9EE2E
MFSLAATAALAVVATGCSSPSTGGTPSPQTSTPATSLPAGTPHVANPLDTSKAQAAPCSVITDQQIAQLGIVADKKLSDASLGPSCDWHDTSKLPAMLGFEVQFVTSNKSGLSSLYEQKDSLRQGGYFEPVNPIQGYPAVLYGQVEDRPDGACGIAVGVSDTLDYSVSVNVNSGPNVKTPCDVAEKIADMVMTNLRAGA